MIAESESDTNLTDRRAAWQARSLDAATRTLLARDSAAFLHQSVSTPCLNAIARAEGIWIEDVAGRRFMDFHGNNVHHIGYGHPRLKRAIAEQMDALPFAPRRYACAPAVRLAETLGAISPGNLGKVLFTTGGSDAIEVAVKIARAATGRHKTLSFWDSFHGAGTGAAAMSGEMLFRSGPAGPMVAGALQVAPFGGYRCPYGTDSADASGRACARMIDYVLARDTDVAALIAEPTRAVPYIPPPGFWAEVRAICDRHGVLLIFDEIPTGLGKTGKMFSCEHDGVAPDILVLGKGLGGGILPIAAVIADRRLDVGGDWAFGHYTHEKNPVTARAALETIAIIEEEGLVENAARVGRLALERLEAMKHRLPAIGDVRGRGCLIGIELVRDRDSRAPDGALAEAVLYRALDTGLSFKTTMGNVLTLTPPLIVSEAQMLDALAIIERAIAAGRP
ncbi:(R)-1-hydroxy-2-aminoethylphosphonate ammonia-lyase [Methylobacterium soli]|uniref:Aspartate aminotransferase family protein n=1 Tax=Methylobacterium soli TaxID=553447 RepID=A0A6L3SWM5_9HYPH|nr:aspartate aminotransferase family protein [Methylobacterium soli]KAB1076556.1 aspartate aminotransferase family protein [Methylobacterium soli]GJE40991.1 Isoleucine 2-epimerase [Methylobacterium soli]